MTSSLNGLSAPGGSNGEERHSLHLSNTSTAAASPLAEVNEKLERVLQLRTADFFRLPQEDTPPRHEADAMSGTGAAVSEETDTWAFSWMPPVEEFCTARQASAAAADRQERTSSDGSTDSSAAAASQSSRRQHDLNSSKGGSSDAEGSGAHALRRKRPRYNDVLLADKSFYNPFATEAMASAFRVCRPLSFAVDVAADGAGARDWFFEDLRERQDRTWADTRVAKGVSRTPEVSSTVVH
eukprot:TRINITY_DN936_c0_g1_i1.p1 TRINITY_DN936_c0_g1~~TRINITY_DN936_c0_g1_i1.p1  ORF type:complete len:240 (-),score=55.87 TRINITY_DN936_c0_g1_i1:333-1052(-)